jgi:hypothetical protein
MSTQEVEAIEINGDLHKREDCVFSEYQDEWILMEDAVGIYGNEYVDQDTADCEFIRANDTEELHHEDDVWRCELTDEFYYHTDHQYESYCGTIGHEENFCESDDYRWVDYGSAQDQYVHIDDCCYCCDIDSYAHTEDCTWSEDDEEYYYDEDEMPEHTSSDCIKSYHSNKSPHNFNDGWEHSVFSIGFEVEKKNFVNETGDESCDRGEYVGSYDFFCGFETDSSCGVEGVSNILPLGSPRSDARKNVFTWIDDAKAIIDSPWDRTCGGHITVSFKGCNDGYDIVDKMRQPLALMYALYRYRLKRSYCNQNKPAKKENNAKYSPVNVKGSRVEFRLPSAVKNTTQLKLRYDLLYKMMHHSLERRVSFEVFLKKVRHIVLKMYNGNENKVDHIYNVAREFRHYLIAEDVGSLVDEFINDKREED